MGGSQNLVDCVKEIATPIVQALQLDLYEVECLGQGSNTVLRVVIDKPGGVQIKDCEQVHASLGRALDVMDPIPHAYRLEVSSPGLDRPFRDVRDYDRAVGKLVRIKLNQPFDGEWVVIGRLVDVEEQALTVARRKTKKKDEVRLTVPWGSIAETRLEVEL